MTNTPSSESSLAAQYFDEHPIDLHKPRAPEPYNALEKAEQVQARATKTLAWLTQKTGVEFQATFGKIRGSIFGGTMMECIVRSEDGQSNEYSVVLSSINGMEHQFANAIRGVTISRLEEDFTIMHRSEEAVDDAADSTESSDDEDSVLGGDSLGLPDRGAPIHVGNMALA